MAPNCQASVHGNSKHHWHWHSVTGRGGKPECSQHSRLENSSSTSSILLCPCLPLNLSIASMNFIFLSCNNKHHASQQNKAKNTTTNCPLHHMAAHNKNQNFTLLKIKGNPLGLGLYVQCISISISLCVSKSTISILYDVVSL